MQTSSRSPFTTIHTEGSLLPVDLLQRVLAGDKDLGGLTPADYHLPGTEKLNEAVNRSWNRLQGAWAAFQTSRARLNPGDLGTTLTRERWLLPLFQELGYGRLVTAKAIEIEGKAYAISHGWAQVPIHLVGCGIDLERRAAGVAGASKSSPHSLMQELLNRDDARSWGILSNGLRLRILRDNASLTRQAYLEFDLEAMFSGEVYADFVMLWLLGHQSRFESAEGKAGECWLETWSKAAQARGTRALDSLRSGVEEAITALGSGFLSHPANQALRAKLRSGELEAQDYYRQLLRLAYRLIFLFAAEDRDLLLDPQAGPEVRQRYMRYYSTARLRRLAERQRGGRHADLWQSLRLLTDILAGKTEGGKARSGLGLPVLNGFLFSAKALPDLEAAQVDNQALLNAVRSLAFTVEGSSRRAVDYKNLGPEELGSVYESLLELHPRIHSEAGTFELASASGSERKTTGSYYTPTSLIQVLLDSALDPVIEQTVKGAGPSGEEQQAALLNLKICDPACGSGHFLIAAAHRIARRLAQIQAGGDEPPPAALRSALRQAIAHCIYGVDVNPMAVELCKVNLWLESIEPGKPLSFLDAHIQCGDSLVGVGPGLDIREIPDEAFNPAFGDDKTTASALKKRNKRERSGQLGFRWAVGELASPEDLARWLAQHAEAADALPEDTPDQVQTKAQAFADFQATQEYLRNRLEYDLWTAAFFWPIPKGDAEQMLAPTQQELNLLRLGRELDARLLAQVRQMAEHLNFFHWELAFPQVFGGETPGFDCVLGNPPWDLVEFSEKTFFAATAPEIAHAPTTRQREYLIDALEVENPALFRSYLVAKRIQYSIRKFVQTSGRYPYSSQGRINLYPIFVEIAPFLIGGFGRVGIIVPSAISMDAYNASLFGWLIENRLVQSLYDFENKYDLFPAVDSRYRFCLLTLSKRKEPDQQIAFCYLCRNVDDLSDSYRRFMFRTSDIETFSPNTLAPPILMNEADAKLAQRTYQRFGVLRNRRTGDNPWMISIQRMLSLSDPGDLFRSFSELKQSGEDTSTWVRVYSGKTIHQYNHRYAQYDGSDWKELSARELEDPEGNITTEYYVRREDVVKRTEGKAPRNWLMAYRDVASGTNERTSIASIIPWTGCDTHCRNIYSNIEPINLLLLLLATLNSIPFDYFCRQKVISTGLGSGVLEQLPLLKPEIYALSDIDFIAPRAFELIYTAWDLKAFADDLWRYGMWEGNCSANGLLQTALLQQSESNRDTTNGGHSGLTPPPGIEICEGDFPFPPFKWSEERRALLRAELDAYYARLYGLSRDELRYILDPQDVYGPDFPGETFRVLKEKEIRHFGEYRTRRLVLEAWDRLEGVEVGGAAGGQSLAPSACQPSAAPAMPPAPAPKPPARQQPVPPAPKKKSAPPASAQPEPLQASFSDFSLYRCEACDKHVMGFDRENHVRDVHKGKKVEWRKVR